jgi:hypothetical protein
VELGRDRRRIRHFLDDGKLHGFTEELNPFNEQDILRLLVIGSCSRLVGVTSDCRWMELGIDVENLPNPSCVKISA